MRNYYRILFAGEVYRTVLAPVFIIGGVLLFQYREKGRKLVALGFGVQIILQGLVALLSALSIVLSFLNPDIPSTPGWFFLAVSTILGLLWVGFFMLFQSTAIRNACAAIPASKS